MDRLSRVELIINALALPFRCRQRLTSGWTRVGRDRSGSQGPMEEILPESKVLPKNVAQVRDMERTALCGGRAARAISTKRCCKFKLGDTGSNWGTKMFFRKMLSMEQKAEAQRRVVVRASATLAAFDEALDALARSEPILSDDLLTTGRDVAEQVRRFERKHAEAAAHVRRARETVASARALARDWGERARLAESESRADLAAQALLLQQEHEAYARSFDDEVSSWERLACHCEAAIEQLRTRLPQ